MAQKRKPPAKTANSRPTGQRKSAGAPVRQRTAQDTRGRPVRPDERSQQIKRVQQKRKKRRKRNYTLYYILLFFFLTVSGVTLSLTVFFNIETISVSGSSLYSEAEILEVLPVKPGDNLLRIRTSAIAQAALEALPQADRVTVKRDFPTGLTVQVTDGAVERQMLSGGKYYQISGAGRVLAISDEPLTDCGCLIMGVDLSLLSEGEYLSDLEAASKNPASDSSEAKEEAARWKTEWSKLESLEILFGELSDTGIEGVEAVDITSEVNMSFYWEGRILVKLGSFYDLEHKLSLVGEILKDPDRLGETAKGILSAESPSSGVVFTPDETVESPFTGEPESDPAIEPESGSVSEPDPEDASSGDTPEAPASDGGASDPEEPSEG